MTTVRIDKAVETNSVRGSESNIPKGDSMNQFTDRRPATITQLQLQEEIGSSSQVKQLSAYQTMADRYTAQQKNYSAEEMIQRKSESVRSNTTGLPDQLKSGIESLSGMSMDHVQIHYNSPQPSEVNAHAFAQGSSIHLAPGQEKHLPHEAWHVVQQAQGRVKPTMQLKNTVSINDDDSLEKEADVMGNKAQNLGAVQLKSITGSIPPSQPSTSSVIQRTVEWKKNNHPNKLLDGFADALDKVVQTGADIALTQFDTLTGDDGYTRLWMDTAQILIADRDNELDYNDYDEATTARRFASARYGYAVEAYANEQKETLQAALPDDYTFQIQGSRGMTRPDFIVYNDSDNEIAWFDITSEGSLSHIDKKTGAGWKTRTYVAEITYPAFDLDNLSTGNSSIGAKVKARNAAKRQRKAWRDYLEDRWKWFDTHYTLKHPGGTISKKANKEISRWAMQKALYLDDLPTETETKSLLRALGEDAIYKYGFDKGGRKSDGEMILRELLDNN